MNKKVTFTVTLVLGILSQFCSTAYALTDCNEILRLGLYNTEAKASQEDSKNIALSELCSTDYSSSSSSNSGSIAAAFSYLRIGGSLNGSNSKQKIVESQKTLCTKGFTSSAYSSSASSYARQVYQGSVDGWSQCVALTSRGMVFNIDTAPDFSVTNVSISWPATSGPSFKGYYNPTGTDWLKGGATCAVSVNGGDPVTAGPATFFPLNGSYNTFNCSRNFYADGSGNAFSNFTRLSFNTSEGNINVDLPPIGNLTGQTVAQITSKFVPITGGTMTGPLNLPRDGLAVGGDQLVLWNGNIGIGTASPQERLHVVGKGLITDNIRGASWGFGGMFQIDDCRKSANVLNPLTGATSCPANYTAYWSGRIWQPETRCGSVQYICIR